MIIMDVSAKQDPYKYVMTLEVVWLGLATWELTMIVIIIPTVLDMWTVTTGIIRLAFGIHIIEFQTTNIVWFTKDHTEDTTHLLDTITKDRTETTVVQLYIEIEEVQTG